MWRGSKGREKEVWTPMDQAILEDQAQEYEYWQKKLLEKNAPEHRLFIRRPRHMTYPMYRSKKNKKQKKKKNKNIALWGKK